MDLGGALVARAQPAEVVQVSEAALDDPALAAEAGAVGGAPSCDPVGDASRPQDAPVLVVVIAAVSKDKIGLSARPADLAGDRAPMQVIKERHQLGDIVAVAARQRDGQRDPASVHEQMVL